MMLHLSKLIEGNHLIWLMMCDSISNSCLVVAFLENLKVPGVPTCEKKRMGNCACVLIIGRWTTVQRTIPRIEKVFDGLNGSTTFSVNDMKSGYQQVKVEESHKRRTAFTIGPLGFFNTIKCPFGLTNSPASYQCLREECLGDLYNLFGWPDYI